MKSTIRTEPEKRCPKDPLLEAVAHPLVQSEEVPSPRRKRKRTIAPLAFLDSLIVAVGIVGAYAIRFQLGIWHDFPNFPIGHYLVALPVMLIVYLVSFSTFNLYETRRTHSAAYLLVECFRASLAATVGAFAVSFWYRDYEYSRWAAIVQMFLVTGLATLARLIYLRILGSIRRQGRDTLRLVVVGNGKMAQKMVRSLAQHPEMGYEIAGFIEPDQPAGDEETGRMEPVLGTVSELLPVVRRERVQEVAVALDHGDPHEVSRVVRRCRDEGLGVKIVPDLSALIIGERGVRCMPQLLWVDIENSVLRRWQSLLKRLMDIMVSVLVLTLGFPVFLLLAILVKVDSKGPVFFRQKRAGVNGKPFTMIKFRSMVHDAEKKLEGLIQKPLNSESPVFKIEKDPRVTRVGRFLRRWSLDELPQFWNVLKGEMSVVGPRPEEVWVASRYNTRASERLRLRPGITGFQQVNCRGSEDFEDRLRYDLFYINNQSFFLDMVVVLETFGTIVFGKGRH